jgi:hypothetical protein
MNGQRNVWFREHALWAGCAKWASDSAQASRPSALERLDLEPVYR